MGARLNGALIGYSLCERIHENPYPGVAFLHALDAARSVAYHGRGTVIASRYRGRMLGRSLLLARQEQLSRRGAKHYLGLTAVGNWPSLASAFHDGGILAGLATDETGLNYVIYRGELFPVGWNHRLIRWTGLIWRLTGGCSPQAG